MILLVFLFFPYTTLGQSLYVGESCTLKNGNSGLCTVLKNCRSVVEELKLGNSPDSQSICSYQGFEPIVCCPGDTFADTTTPFPVESKDEIGTIAKQKCAEYSQYVYTLMHRPFVIRNQQLVNVSQCASKNEFWIGNDRNANPKELPFMAAIGYDLKKDFISWVCGGTLISETFVLTAAYCTNLSEWGDATWVRVGELNLIQPYYGASPMDRRIIERIRHPGFNPPLQYHDIALLRLESRVPFNGWIRPACLHTAPASGTRRAIMANWGRVTDDGRNLRLAIIPLVDTDTCNTKLTSETPNTKLPNGIVGNWSVCTAAEERETCQAEAGGPLVIYSKQEYYCMYDVIGVMGYGKLCNGQSPGIYNRVYYYLQWIESTVWG